MEERFPAAADITLEDLIAVLIGLIAGSTTYFSYLVQHGIDHIEVRIVQDSDE